MRLDTARVEIPSEDGAFPGFMARPQAVSGPLPGVVVIQEIWGTDGHIEDVCQRFATAGYVALAPDLYAHGGRRPSPLEADRVTALKALLDRAPRAWGDAAARQEALSSLPEAEQEAVSATFAAMMGSPRPMDRYIGDLRSAVKYLGMGPSAGRSVGSVGFCMGGELSGNLACVEQGLAAAVIFYGPEPPEDRLPGISCPLLGLYGADDHRVTDGVEAFQQRLLALDKQFAHIVYADSPHAFFNDTRPSYRPEAARDAFARTLGFFAEHLH